MSLNKQILQKVVEKTDNKLPMRKFIVNILQEENKGIGWYTKFYKAEIEKAIMEDRSNEN